MRAVASATARRDDACGGTGWSRQTAMSEPSASWTAIECSGVKRWSRAVEMRAERDAVVVDRAQVAQADHLVAAGVGQDRPVPGHELVQAAEALDALVAGPQVQVVGVAQDDLGADLVEVVGIERLDRGVGADRHEHAASRRRRVASSGRPAARASTPSAGGGMSTSKEIGRAGASVTRQPTISCAAHHDARDAPAATTT